MVSKESRWRQWLTPLFKILLAGALIYWLVQSGRFDLNELKKISSPWIWIVGVLLFFGVLAVNSKRWQILLSFESLPVTFLKIYKLSLIGIFFNFFMPGGVGGDVVKAGFLMRDVKAKKWFIGWSTLVDRIFGLLALMLYSGIAGLFFYQDLPEKLQMGVFTMSSLILLGFVVLILFLIVSPKKKIEGLLKSHPFVEKVLLPLFFFFQRPKKVVVPFLLSLIGQGVVIGIGVFLGLFLGVDIPWWEILIIFPFGFLATILPISPAGIGVGQAAFYYLFKEVAGNGEFGVLLITFYQAVQFVVGLFGGLIFVLYKKDEV
jgi:uncharacterized protein (TIRG00374 family)